MASLEFDYDAELDVMTIEGIRYSGQFFRDFARGLPLEQLFTIQSRENGVVYIQTHDARNVAACPS